MTIIPDQPITKIEQDLFGRSEFAKRIAGVISSLDHKSSIVVSINAPWGEGKTSVLYGRGDSTLRGGGAAWKAYANMLIGAWKIIQRK